MIQQSVLASETGIDDHLPLLDDTGGEGAVL
jgi:hypothetical protein